MNILMISRGMPTSHNPQWGNFEKKQALALKQQGHNVITMSIDHRISNKKWIGYNVVEDDGIMFYTLNVPPFIHERTILAIPVLRKLGLMLFRRILKDGHEIDLIYSHYLPNSLLALDIKKKYNLPLVAIEHWSKLTYPQLPLYVKIMGQMVYKKADRVIAVSKSLKNCLFKHFNVESVVVNNMVNSENDNSYVKQKIELIKLVSVGSLIKRKGYDTLIKAFALYHKDNPKVELTIVGNGVELNNLSELTNKLGIKEAVHFVGRKNSKEISEILSDSDAFVLTSRCETFGVVYIEAMSHGLPVIGTICGGPEEFITLDNGILVKPDDVAATYDAIKELANNFNNYDRFKIASECKHKFSPEVISKQLCDCFESVVNKNRG